MIQGFNQGGQRAVGIIRLQLTMEDMISTTLFHIIDAKTSYNMLLGRPWLHENVVVPSTWHQCFKYSRNGIVKKEEEGEHEALAIDEKEFDPKAFKLLVKAGYNPKEKSSLGKLPPKPTGKMLHGLNATQIMLKEKGHAVQDSRIGLGSTPPKPVRIAIRRVSSNYAVEGFSSTENDKAKENPRESVFNRLDPHRKALHGIANKQSVFDRLGPRKRMGYQKKGAFKVTAFKEKYQVFAYTKAQKFNSFQNEAPDNFSYIMWKNLEGQRTNHDLHISTI
ncbi:UNVERIFIED_CONTAM: hypothetical protein Slati_3050200 [Sesamum latifolium]|uniref:G-patch domain-containing protein n=1 Tax=Sesamum latifolium TaxID=2727402 RepID=A0AAW2UUH4_9LAMI